MPEGIIFCQKAILNNLSKNIRDVLLGESTGLSKLMFSLTVTGNEGWKEGIREQGMCSVFYSLTEHWQVSPFMS